MLTDNVTKPWYKHKWLWFLLIGPGIVVVASIVTIYIAVTKSDSLIVDDYYKEGTTINENITKDQKAAKLGLTAELVIGDDQRIRVFLHQTKNPVKYPKLKLFVQHAANEKLDQHIELQPDGVDSYVSKQLNLPIGKWYFDLSDSNGDWKLTGFIKFGHEFQTALKPA
ncbi:FixH family protein [Leeia oryzae]|uniref:FixH family protein n=1 Tax=Leeia oryzae TaxID=356662 RepID=UPI000375B9E1|nr:FixH family protein [Leeia oryzae]